MMIYIVGIYNHTKVLPCDDMYGTVLWCSNKRVELRVVAMAPSVAGARYGTTLTIRDYVVTRPL
jgi:hypothetical protein